MLVFELGHTCNTHGEKNWSFANGLVYEEGWIRGDGAPHDCETCARCASISADLAKFFQEHPGKSEEISYATIVEELNRILRTLLLEEQFEIREEEIDNVVVIRELESKNVLRLRLPFR